MEKVDKKQEFAYFSWTSKSTPDVTSLEESKLGTRSNIVIHLDISVNSNGIQIPKKKRIVKIFKYDKQV